MRKKKSAIAIWVAILIVSFSKTTQCQQIIGNEVYSIFPVSSEVISSTFIDNNLGTLPVIQGTNTDMWGGQFNLNNSQQTLNAVDALDTGELFGTTSADYDAAPPPNDPMDIPIDTGVAILLTVAVVLGYKHKNTLSHNTNPFLCHNVFYLCHPESPFYVILSEAKDLLKSSTQSRQILHCIQNDNALSS